MSTYETKDKYPGQIEKRECAVDNLSETFLENFKKKGRPRSNWGIENKLHWALDMSLNEDRCSVVNGFAEENLEIISKRLLNLLNQDKLTKKKYKIKMTNFLIGKQISQKGNHWDDLWEYNYFSFNATALS